MVAYNPRPKSIAPRRSATADDSLANAALPTWKRALDITLCALALLILFPVMFVVTLIIKTSSPGPVLFRQERVGLNGRRFLCYKFRTMKAGASTSVHQEHLRQLMSSDTPMQKMDARGDSRLIRGGAILRATGLDELPQIINVLRGEMSLVGPRPCVPYEYESYEAWQKARFAAVPGLTGLWQVSGKNKTTFTEMINLDIRYAHTKSLGLDLAIIARTVPALVNQVVESRRQRAAAPAVPAHPPVRSAAAGR